MAWASSAGCAAASTVQDKITSHDLPESPVVRIVVMTRVRYPSRLKDVEGLLSERGVDFAPAGALLDAVAQAA
ncbi:MAG: hypothetical protein Q8M88_15665 [Phenylobacterium sp.]|uniref:hypothetical protein n=1 Tax=Phenylobacterium sp. TaxID=1871053 RepID=UPI0027373E45|nr:hypothetical protein [Phenylobacterium sp.]MDP3175866.1 hypothetical protein [Phenylobacterium sp.]